MMKVNFFFSKTKGCSSQEAFKYNNQFVLASDEKVMIYIYFFNASVYFIMRFVKHVLGLIFATIVEIDWEQNKEYKGKYVRDSFSYIQTPESTSYTS